MSDNKYLTEHFDCGTVTVGRFFEKDKNGNNVGEIIKVQIIDDGIFSPHIQISRASDDLCACVKLDVAEYLLCVRHKRRLTDGQINGLIGFLNSASDFPAVRLDGTTYKLKTMWDYTIVAWNRESDEDYSRFALHNDGDGYLVPPKMPDYTKLNRDDIRKTICDCVDSYELARVDKKDTGLKYDLMIDSRGKDRRGVPPHIFVCVGDRLIWMNLSSGKDEQSCDVDPEGFDDVRKYVRAYMQVFLAHYNKLLTDRQALNLLLSIEEADSESVNLMFRKVGIIKENL